MTEHWEPVLAAPFDVFGEDFVKSARQSFFGVVNRNRRRRWFRAVHRANLLLFAYSEAISRRLLDKLESMQKVD